MPCVWLFFCSMCQYRVDFYTRRTCFVHHKNVIIIIVYWKLTTDRKSQHLNKNKQKQKRRNKYTEEKKDWFGRLNGVYSVGQVVVGGPFKLVRKTWKTNCNQLTMKTICQFVWSDFNVHFRAILCSRGRAHARHTHNCESFVNVDLWIRWFTRWAILLVKHSILYIQTLFKPFKRLKCTFKLLCYVAIIIFFFYFKMSSLFAINSIGFGLQYSLAALKTIVN